MRRALLCLVLLLSPAAASAADGVWTAQQEDDEGGPVMVASVSAEASGDVTPMLRVICAGAEGVMLRYEMASEDGTPGSEADFLFENESTQVSKHMVYEDMDGAFAAYFPKTDPIISLLKTGEEVFVSESTGNYPAQTFALKGSSKAIDTVIKQCQ